MNELEAIDIFGFPPRIDALVSIRRELRSASDRETVSQGTGDTELMRVLCAQLFAIGSLDDVFLIWGAKQSSMDAAASIDVQLLCGAGLEETRKFLVQSLAPQAAEALQWIDICKNSGDFDDFDPHGYLVYLMRYYLDE